MRGFFTRAAASATSLLVILALSIVNAPNAFAAPTISVGTVTTNNSFTPLAGFVMGTSGNTFTIPVTVTNNGGGDTGTRRMTISTQRSGGGNALTLQSTGSSASGGGVTWSVESVSNPGTPNTIAFHYAEAVLIPNGTVLTFTVAVSNVGSSGQDRTDSFSAIFLEGSGGQITGNAPNTLNRYSLSISAVTPPATGATVGTTVNPVLSVFNHASSSVTLASSGTSIGGTAFFSTGTAGSMPALSNNATGTVTYTGAVLSSSAGSATVTATAANSAATARAPNFSSNITLSPGALDHFTVTAPGSATAGTPFTMTAVAKDASGNTITNYAGTIHMNSSDPGATLPADYTFIPADNGSHTFANGVTLVTAGSRTINVSAAGKTGSATVSVSASGLDHITIAPDPATIVAGATQSYTATGFDAYGNSLGDVTSATTFIIDGGGSCTVANCGANNAGTYTVTGTDTGQSATATLHVGPAGLDHFSVTAPGSATAGSAFNVTVAAEDVYGNTVTGYTGIIGFTSSDPGATLPSDYTFVSGDSGSHTFTAGVTLVAAGSHTVAVAGSGKTGSASVTVAAAAIDHLVISPGSASIVAGATQAYTAEAFDIYGNSRGEVTSSTVFTIDGAGTCSAADCGSNVTGTYTVTGTHLAHTGTATLHVTHAALASIVVSPDGTTIQEDTSQPFTAEGFDTYGNTLGDVTADTVFSIDGSGSCAAASCGSDFAGDYIVTGTNGLFVDTTALHVIPSATIYIRISPSTPAIVAGTTQTFISESWDGVDFTDVTSATTFTIDSPGSCTGAVCGASVAGSYTVTADYQGNIATAELQVNPGALDHIVVSPDGATIEADDTQAFTAEAFDAYGNTLGDVTSSTAFSDERSRKLHGRGLRLRHSRRLHDHRNVLEQDGHGDLARHPRDVHQHRDLARPSHHLRWRASDIRG